MRHFVPSVLLGALAAASLACQDLPIAGDPTDTDTLARTCVDEPVPTDAHPRLLVTADRKADLIARMTTPPLDVVTAQIEAAAQATPTPIDANVWSAGANGDNADIAMNSALLGWLRDDPALTRRAADLLLAMPANYETNTDWDVDIGMPSPLIGYAVTWDLLAASGQVTEGELAQMRQTLLTVTGGFFDQFLNDDVHRRAVLGVAQNNHPIRAASAIGAVALLFPDAPDADVWLNWATSEVAYLLGPDGRYLQADGGVSEGPFYYSFAYVAAMPFLIAMDNAHPADRCLHTDCRNRNPIDPWLVTDCVDGAPFVFPDLLRTDPILKSMEWSLSMRLPNGYRNAMDDAHLRVSNGTALLTAWHQAPWLMWDFMHPAEGEVATMDWGMDLRPWHLAYLDPTQAPVEPNWKSRFFRDTGHAFLRTGWGHDDLWGMLVAEAGPSRKTLHDHVDGLQFTVAAYDEVMLMDSGYFKPNDFTLPETSHPQSHNVLLIDGKGAPDKGLLTAFGDTDAFLEHPIDGGWISAAEARESYEGHTIVRTLALVRDGWFVVSDTVTADAAGDHAYRWRVHPYAGGDTMGTVAIDGDTLHVVRNASRLDVHLASTLPGLAWEDVPRTKDFAAPHVHDLDGLGHHAVLDGVVDGSAPGFLAILAPFKEGAAPVSVTAEDTPDHTAGWRVGEDFVFLRDPGAADTFTLSDGTVVETDARWGVVGLADGAVYLSRGTYVTVDGVRTDVDAADGVGVESP